MDPKTIAQDNTTLRESRRNRDALLREIERMPDARQGSPWHSDRVDALHATRATIQRIEDHLGVLAEPDKQQQPIGVYRLVAGSESKYEVLDASKDEGVLFITARPEGTTIRDEFHLLQRAVNSLEFTCVIGSASVHPDAIGIGQEFTSNPSAILPCEVRAFEHAAWENVASAAGYAVVVGDHGETMTVALGNTEEEAWVEAGCMEHGGTTRESLAADGYRVVPITTAQRTAIQGEDLTAFSPDVSGYQWHLPSYLRDDSREEASSTTLGL